MAGWEIREGMIAYDLDASYTGYPTHFSILLHYGGEFTKFPNRRYIKGKLKYIDNIDIDLFSIHDIDEIMQVLECVEEGKPIYYHFKRPLSDLDFGIFALASDQDVHHLSLYVREHKLVEVYTEFWHTKLHTYAMSPNPPKVRIGEISEAIPRRLYLGWADTNTEDGVNNPPPVIEPVVDNDATLTSPMISHVIEPIVTSPNVIEPTVTSPNVIEPTVTSPNVIEPTVEPNVSDNLAGSDSEVSEGSEDGSDSEDSDFVVDEDNLLDDPDVDMKDFHLNIDKDVEWIGDIPVITDEVVVDDEELEVIDTEVLLSGSSGDEGKGNKRRKKIRDEERAHRNEAAIVKDPFYVNQTFGSNKEVKQMVYKHSIETRRDLVIVKNDKNRIRVVCGGTIPNLGILETGGPSQSSQQGGPSQKKKVRDNPKSNCPWVLLVSKWKKDIDWTVKTYEKEHRCLQTRKIKACNYKFLSQHITEQLESNPEVPIRALREQLERKYMVGLSDMKVHRAKAKALETIRGDYSGQYEVLRDYLEELQARNPNTTVKLEVESEANYASPTRVFKRVYVCLGALKRGFAACKRDFLGLDGCFMKGPYPGMILTAVGMDGNNCTYPLAYAVVEAENFNSWSWFLTHLGEDLDLNSNSNFTFITDRQKGLLPAVAKLFPCAEHRYCLRHLHENMKLKWRGKEYKDCLWKCATSTTVPHFNLAMEELKQLNTAAYEWLKAIPPKHWSRSHFSGRCHCDALLNNLSESLNSKLVKGRDKPIVTCLEFIREYIMKKLVIVQKTIDKSIGPLTPTATKTLEKIKNEASNCRVVFCGNEKYQVTGVGLDQCVVDMAQKTCSCNKWELTSIPYKHTIAAIWDMMLNNADIGIPETFVHPTYWLSTWKEMYVFKVEPINGRFMWKKSACPTKLLAPKHHVPIGRPKKKRRRAATEDDGDRMSTKWKSVTCSKCGNVGHNGKVARDKVVARVELQVVARAEVQEVVV